MTIHDTILMQLHHAQDLSAELDRCTCYTPLDTFTKFYWCARQTLTTTQDFIWQLCCDGTLTQNQFLLYDRMIRDEANLLTEKNNRYHEYLDLPA